MSQGQPQFARKPSGPPIEIFGLYVVNLVMEKQKQKKVAIVKSCYFKIRADPWTLAPQRPCTLLRA